MPGTAGRSGGDRVSQGADNFPSSSVELPQSLGGPELEVWRQIMGMLPPEMLRSVDVFQLKVLCDSLVHIDRLAAAMQADPEDHKVATRYLQFAQHITRLSAQFGLSPADRARIKFELPPPEDDASEWEQE